MSLEGWTCRGARTERKRDGLVSDKSRLHSHWRRSSPPRYYYLDLDY